MKFNKGKVRNKIAYSKNTASAILLIWKVPADREDLACLLPIDQLACYQTDHCKAPLSMLHGKGAI